MLSHTNILKVQNIPNISAHPKQFDEQFIQPKGLTMALKLK